MMKRDRRYASFVLGILVALAWLPFSAAPSSAFSSPPSTDDDARSAKNGDFLVYSLQTLGIQITSVPGVIKDGVVASFSTGTTADPRAFLSTSGSQSWESTLSAFLSFLRGGSSLPFFDQTGSGWGFVVTPGLTPLPTSYGPGRGWVCLDAAGASTACDGSGNPVVIGPIHHNAGKKILDELEKSGAAYAILFPSLAACHGNGASAARCALDSVSTRLDLDAIIDAGNPFIIVAQEVTVTPEPVTMVLGGTGLILLGYAARRRLFGGHLPD